MSNLTRLRVDLRLLADLIACGVLNEKDSLPVLGNALAYLVQCEKNDHAHLPVLNAFCRFCGEDYGNYIATRYRNAARSYNIDLPETVSVVAPEKRKAVVGLLKEYFNKLTIDLTTVSEIRILIEEKVIIIKKSPYGAHV